MKKLYRFFLLPMVAGVVLIIGVLHSALLWAQPPQYLGEVKPIWRMEPVIGRWLSGGQGLVRPPVFLSETSFPYTKRPFEQEVLFADRLLVVRLLGGWNTDEHVGELNGSKAADVAYRDDSGNIRYRWNLMFNRLEPYILNGYTDLTLVLDNIPWDFPTRPEMGKYGQTSPPSSMQEWQSFTQALAEQLVARYGEDTASRFRFRLGTECEATKRFSGNQAQYTQLYVSTLKGIRSVLPHSQIGPCNHSGGKDNMAGNNIDFSRFYADVAQEIGSDYKIADFFPVSTYYVQKKRERFIKASRVRNAKGLNERYWKKVMAGIPIGDTPAREVHEAGLLVNTSAGTKGEQGVLGAAWYLKTLVDMQKIGVSGVAHWRVLDKVGGQTQHSVLTGTGWVLSVLEHLVGGQLYVYEDETRGDVNIMRLLVVKEEASYLIVSTLGGGREVQSLLTSVPLNLLHQKDTYRFMGVMLKPKNSICNIIKADLAEAGALKPDFVGDLSPCIDLDLMMTHRGKNVLNQNWEHYEDLMIKSLTLMDASTQATQGDNQIQFKLYMPVPAIQVIQIR